MCTYASTYTSSICNNIVRAEFKNLFQIMLKKWSEFSIVTFLYYSPLFVFFPPEALYYKQFQFKWFGSKWSQYLFCRVICCLYFVSLVLSSPHLCFCFSPTLDSCSFLKDWRISVHCFLKFWVRSSETSCVNVCSSLPLDTGHASQG